MKLGAQFIEIIENQLSSNDPAYVKSTLDRLQKAGYPEKEAKELIATCVAHEMFEMLNEDRVFNDANYRQLLNQLPKLPE